MIENHSGYHFKVIHTYRGGGFLSKQFNLFCDKEGIQMELTAPYTPQ